MIDHNRSTSAYLITTRADHSMIDHNMVDHNMIDLSISDHNKADHSMIDRSMSDHHMSDHHSMTNHNTTDHNITDHNTAAIGASALFMAVLWISKLQPVPQLSKGFILALLPVALFHTIGHVSACISFSHMAVSFTHIIKSSEPVGGRCVRCPVYGCVCGSSACISLRCSVLCMG
jgi:hypothetical protein